MASVHRRVHRGRVTYRAVWRESGPGGKAQLRNKSFARAADAKAYAARMEAEIERRGVGDPARHSVEQYLFRWLATLRDRGEHSPATLECYTRCITAAKPWVGDIPLSKLSTADLDHGLRRAPQTRGQDARWRADAPAQRAHRAQHSPLPTHCARTGAQVEADRREPGA